MSLWVQVSDIKVEDFETNNGFAVKEVVDAVGRKSWNVVRYATNSVTPNTVLGEGYRSEAEAINALTVLLSDMGIAPARIQPPVTEEEIRDTTTDQKEGN